MLDKINFVKNQFREDITSVKSLSDLEKVRLKYLSRKGSVADLFLDLKNVASDERPGAGKLLNEIKNIITKELENLQSGLAKKDGKNSLDITLPGRRPFV